MNRVAFCGNSIYDNLGIAEVMANLLVRQEKLLKTKEEPQHILGLTISPSKTVVDSIPFMMRTDIVGTMDLIQEFSDYIVINISERDKSKRSTMMHIRQKEELTKLVRQVKERTAITLGKIAALEYSELLKSQSDFKMERVNAYEQIKKTTYRNCLITKNTAPMIFLKIDSYLTEEEYKTIAEIIISENIDGAIIGSTVPINVGVKDKSKRLVPDQVALGGAGGFLTKQYATYALQNMYKYTKGQKLLISSGGVFTGQDMYDRMAGGANLVQIYSALAFRGPYVAKAILDEFATLLKDNGETVHSIVGKQFK